MRRSERQASASRPDAHAARGSRRRPTVPETLRSSKAGRAIALRSERAPRERDDTGATTGPKPDDDMIEIGQGVLDTPGPKMRETVDHVPLPAEPPG